MLEEQVLFGLWKDPKLLRMATDPIPTRVIACRCAKCRQRRGGVSVVTQPNQPAPTSQPCTADRWRRPKDAHFAFKISVLGSRGVGKSALFTRTCENHFMFPQATGLNCEFRYLHVLHRYKVIKLQLWDTYSARYGRMSPVYYRNLDGAMICFDLTDRPSYDNVRHLMHELQHQVQEQEDRYIPPVILVGCKTDLIGVVKPYPPGTTEVWERCVSREEAMELADSLSLAGYVECSARTGAGVAEAVGALTRECVSRVPSAPQPEPAVEPRGNSSKPRPKDSGCVIA